MKKLITLSIAILLLSACTNQPSNNVMYVKPFIIIYKKSINDYEARYTFQDAKGNTKDFYEYINKYSIGDTLK